MIFYFTGTGNSLYAAKYLDSEIVSIPQVINNKNQIYESETIGIVCPIYGHEMPKMVKDFIKKATFDTQYLFLVLTFGSRHANAVELAEKVFKTANKNADYITTLLMVDNFLPAFDMKKQITIVKNVEEQLAIIKSDINNKKHEHQKVSIKDRFAHKGYVQLVKNSPETVWANFDFTDDCVGCGICTKVCPANCISIENQKAIRVDKNCQACYACIHACPKFAIKVRKTFGFDEKNPKARYRNEHITLCELVESNNQIK